MTDEQRAELKRLAEAATKGPWFVGHWYGRCLVDHKHGGPNCRYTFDRPAEIWQPEGTGISSREPGRVVVRNGYDGAEIDETDARFIAAANPAAVLDLLKEHEEDQGVISVWRGRTERAEAERVALMAEVEALKLHVTEVEQELMYGDDL